MATRLAASGAASMSASLRNPTPVRPEPVEGLLSTSLSWKGQGFDKLSPNGNGNVAEARPFGWRLVREPGILALRISACRLLPRSDGFLAGKSADQERADLAHADASHDGEIGIELPGEQRSNLLDRTALEHVGEAFVTPAVKPVSWWKQDQRAKVDFFKDPAFAMLLPFHQRASRREHDFEGARDPGSIAGVQTFRGFWIMFEQLRAIVVDRRTANLVSDLGVDAGNGSDPEQQGPKVQARSAHQDRQAAGFVHICNLFACPRGPIGCRAGMLSVHESIKPVLGASALLRAWSRTEHRQLPVNLCAISVEDHSIGLFRESNRKCRLAAGRRPRN